jgi:hypothetical protein
MDFREFAAKETSELAARLAKAASAVSEQAVKQTRDEAQKVADALRDQLQTALKEKTATAGLLKDAQAQADRLRGELKATAERVEAAGRQLEETRKTVEKLEATRAELTAARDEQSAARKTVEADLRKARETVDGLRAELANATKTLERTAGERLAAEETAAAAHSNSQAAEAKLSAVTELLNKSASRVKTLEQGHQDQERKIQALEAKLQSAAAAPAAPAAATASSAPVLEELLSAFQALSSAATIAEVLTTLVEQMAAQFPRVALFRVKKGHLQGEHQIGFDLKTDIGKLVMPLGMDSLPSRAASSGQIESLTGDALRDSKVTPFSGTPSCALAVPIVVAGETLAIVYADDSGAPKSAKSAADTHMRYADALRQYAVALLMRVTKELKALAELQKYAASLLHEMEQMYDADVESGLTGADLQKRLAGNLDFARSIYGSRTALEGADAATLLDEELASLLDARKGTPFARDLAAAAGHAQPRSAAEAS